MVRLEKEMAVIGTVNELLRQGAQGVRVPDSGDGESLSMNEDIVFQYSRMMEARSGYAVVNGFSSSSLNQFFSDCDQLFQYDPYHSTEKGKQSYRLRVEELLPPSELPEGSLYSLEPSQIQTLVGHMVDILDPSVNYPFDFLKDMRLLDALAGDEEHVHGSAMER